MLVKNGVVIGLDRPRTGKAEARDFPVETVQVWPPVTSAPKKTSVPKKKAKRPAAPLPLAEKKKALKAAEISSEAIVPAVVVMDHPRPPTPPSKVERRGRPPGRKDGLKTAAICDDIIQVIIDSPEPVSARLISTRLGKGKKIGSAMTRLRERGEIVAVTEGKFPAYALKSPEVSAPA